jgi:hypothetical protein
MRALLWLVIALVGVVVVVVVKVLISGSKKNQATLPYQKEDALFTPAERVFLAVLETALGNQFRVLGKVRLADVIKVKPGLDGGARQQAFNRIQSKHLDFVVCNPQDLSVQFVVELDDSSHQKAKRQARDEFLDQALAAADVPVFHFPVKRTYSAQEIQSALFEQPPSMSAN